MKAKRAALIEALTGKFDDHHAELARMLLDQIDALTAPDRHAHHPDRGADRGDPRRPGRRRRRHHRPAALAPARAPPGSNALTRLDEIPGISAHGAQIILAEIGLDMTRFPTAGHLVSWAKLCPRTIQSGAKNRSGRTGKGNPYLKGVLGEIAAAAAKTDTFLGERYRRIVKRRGKLKALVAVARTILVIIWHLLADPAARYDDLGAGYYASRIDTDRKIRNHIRQLEALGYTVTLTQAA